MKDLQNLTGAKILSKKELQSVKGGCYPGRIIVGYCGSPGKEDAGNPCPPQSHCEGEYCVRD